MSRGRMLGLLLLLLSLRAWLVEVEAKAGDRWVSGDWAAKVLLPELLLLLVAGELLLLLASDVDEDAYCCCCWSCFEPVKKGACRCSCCCCWD